jgi:hypothetical protein
MYYGSESFNEKEFTKDKPKNAKFGKIYLYKATKQGDNWTNGKPLPFNNKAYDVRNPSISKDGKTLYFSSNMPGGFGGEDIWKVSVNGDEYGTPENLGAKVNTEANESFPFITEDTRRDPTVSDWEDEYIYRYRRWTLAPTKLEVSFSYIF